ncbi:MAG TPA: mechanosensitive ion channel domain-containing protein [Saprospiraceae bacterium]|nr:mechanosensitive ion channel domain-containing protein [Saprospiraceae bacterium]
MQLTKQFYRLLIGIFVTLLFLFLQPIFSLFGDEGQPILSFLLEQQDIFLILSISWTMILLIKVLKRFILDQYDLSEEDNLSSRKMHTQIRILERILIFLIILFAVGMILLSFESIREIGIGLFTSAGLAGIVLGLSAQKVVGALLAGVQIALTQPFRIDDAVVVEGEWGWIEEINLTYIVIRLWDKRRLVLPSTYFLEKPFQNWTRTSADIVGSVFIHTDYTVSFDALREELTRLLKATPLWDGQANVLQVTDAKKDSVEIRILVSAKNSPTAWDLRVHIREKMIAFIQEHYPSALPRTRVMLEEKAV